MRVGIDVTPLAGPRTGIGQSVAQIVASIGELAGAPELIPYVMSWRAKDLEPGTRRLPYPAGLAVRLWGRAGRPTGRRTLGDVNVVHGTNYIAPPTGKPTLLTINDCSFVLQPDGAPKVVQAFAPVVRRLIHTHGAWAHVPSQAVAERVAEIFATDRIEVIPYGVPDLAPVVVGAAPVPGVDGRPAIVSIARLEPRKNLPRLVEAFAAVQAEVPDAVLVLAGPDGDDRAAIDAAIDRLPRKAGEQVLLTGWLDDAHRTALLQQASVLAYPSRDEGFGFPVLEAMRSGVPVVASAVGSIPEVAGEAALLVPPDDTDALAEALVTVLTDAGRRRALIEAGHANLHRFSWLRTAEKLTALYRRLA